MLTPVDAAKHTDDDDACPGCGADLRGKLIPQEYIDKGYYEPGTTRYSRRVGAVKPGVYDGVLYWICPDCGHTWHRWPEGDYRRARAEPFVAS